MSTNVQIPASPSQAGSGTAAAPSLGVATGYGWYYDSVNASLAAATAGVQAVRIDASQNITALGTAISIPSASAVFNLGPNTSSGIQLKYTAGQLQLLNPTGGTSSIYVTGATVSGNIYTNASGGSGPTNCGYGFNVAGGASLGMYNPAVNSIGLATNGLAAVVIDASQNAVFSATVKYKAATANKTTSYTVLTTDSATTFDNTGAAGQVVYTLPAAAAGLTFSFTNTAAGAGFTKAMATGTDKIAQLGVLGGAAGFVVSTAIWTTITLTCSAAGTWVVTGVTGTWTLA
jgi:hypothetical protein